MRDGMIVQSGKYDVLLDSGLDFGALVAAHETSMELVENSTQPQKSPRSSAEVNGENNTADQPESEQGTSKLIEEEEKETGKVDLHVYKEYCTEAYGWWGVAIVLLLSLLWQVSQMAGDYWLAYETSAKRAISFNPFEFISVYAIIVAFAIVVVTARAFTVTEVGLKTAQVFFSKIMFSILHAPMSFFDTTPSGRILSRVRSEISLTFYI